MDNEQPHGSDEVGKIENTARGSVYGFVVQTGVVHGGLHLTPAAPAKVIPRQLPGVVPHFVGRKAELDALSALAAASYTVDGAASIATIGGAAGVGKTSLALHWARLATQRFPDGQLYVNLRGFDPTGAPVRPEEAVRTFLGALDVPSNQVPVGLDGQVGLYRSLVADRRLLVILDNARDSEQVRPLLPGSRTCFVIITSRNRLTGLIAHDGAEPMTVDMLTQEESTVVITRRLGQRGVSDEREAVSQLVNLCTGLPLALAIVSARAASHPTIPLAELATELRETCTGLDAFDAGEINVNLRAVFSWSNSVLSDEATTMFRLFGMSPGPDISVKTAASLAGVSESKAVAMLGELQRAHLVQRYMSGRYRMHDLVRLYARGQADQLPADEHRAALERLFSFYVQTLVAGDQLFYPQRPAIEIAPPLPGCATQPLDDVTAALAWFDAERSNLLAAQALAALGGLHKWAWQMAWALTVFLWWRGHLADNVAVWRTGLAAAEHLADRDMQALSHRRLGDACSRLGLHTEAIDHLRLALNLPNKPKGSTRKHTSTTSSPGL